MRQTIIGIALFIVGLLGPIIWERIMNAAPEWAWGLAFFAVIVAGLLFVALSDPIYSRILGQQRTRVGSTIIVGLISGIIVGAGWWFFVLPYPLPIQEPEKGRLQLYIMNRTDITM